jgi:hypothetical protein
MLAGILAGVFMGLSDRAVAQQIGGDTENISSFPTVGSSSSGSTTPNTVPTPPPLPPPPPPLLSTSSLFSPVVPYGGGFSQSGEMVAEEMAQASANQPYNLRVGPVQIRAEGDLTISANDNIGLTKNGREADVTFDPMGILHGRWALTELNTLTFNIGIGYQAYLLHSQYDCVIIAPDSAVNFNLFIGDVKVSFFDAFSYQQDPTQVGQLSNQVRLSQFNNDAGVSATWDIDPVTVELSYQHSNLWVIDSIYDYLTNQSDTFAPTVTYKLNETMSAGFNATFSDTRYEKDFENDNTSESAGPFVSATFSDSLSLTAGAGVYLAQYDQGGGNGDNSDLFSYYANLGINHRLTKYLTQSFTAGKQYLPGLTSNYTSRIYATYGDQWNATNQISVGANLLWENLDDSDARLREDSDRYGFNLNLSDALTEHFTISLGYQFLLKDADPSDQSYYQDVGTLGMAYNF